MTEPTTSTAGGVAVWKIGSFILGIGIIAAAMAFLILPPRSVKEYAMRSLATITGSALCGPMLVFAVYQKYPSLFDSGASMAAAMGFDPWVGTLMAAAPLLALAGIPFWWVLGALVLWFDKRNGRDIVQLAGDAKADLKSLGG